MKTLQALILGLIAGLLSPGLNLHAQDNQNCVPVNPNGTYKSHPDLPPKVLDPVTPAYGDYTLNRTDLVVPGVMPIVFSRNYSSSMGVVYGIMGSNWDYSFNHYVVLGLQGESSGMIYHSANGVDIALYYPKEGELYDSTQAQSKQSPYYEMHMEGSLMVVSDGHGNKDYFDPSTTYDSVIQVEKSTDRNGNELDYTYVNRIVSEVSDPASGRYIKVNLSTAFQISSITDSAGRTVSYSYTLNGQPSVVLSQVTYPATTEYSEGTTESYTFDSDLRMTGVLDGNGNASIVNTYAADDIHSAGFYKIGQQTFNGNTGTITYNYTTNVNTVTDFRGHVTDYANDTDGNVTKISVHKYTQSGGTWTDSGQTYDTLYEYGNGATDTDGHYIAGPAPASGKPNNGYRTKVTYPNGNGVSWAYDAMGNVLTEKKFAPSGTTVDSSKGTQVTTATTTYTYEPLFYQVASVTDANGNTTTYNYGDTTSNPTANLMSITYPTTAAGAATESFTYNGRGQVVTHTLASGTVVKNIYDETTGDLTYGFLLQTIQDYGTGKFNATTTYTYDAYGNVASITTPNGNITRTTYDAQGHVTQIDGATCEVEQRSYDADGNMVLKQKQAPGSGVWQKTVNVYNTVEQLTSTQVYTDATNFLTTSYTYDGNGNTTQITDPLGHTAATVYDAQDRVCSITDALGNKTKFSRDGNGNAVGLTDELGHVTTYTFDGFDRMEQKSFPDSSYQTWKYDALGNVTSLLTTAGNTISQTYDTRNAMLTQTYGSSTITNTYDIMQRLLTTTEHGASLTYVYDALGRNTSFTDQAGHTSAYTYDLDGDRLNSTYPTSVTVKQAYDNSDRLTTLKDGSDTTQATYTYDILDRTTGVTLANSTSVSYGYDLLNRLSYVNNSLGGTVARNHSYVYDDDGRRTSETESRGTVAYGYSDRDELSSVTEPSGSPFADQSFTFDAGFNRSNWTLGSTSKSYTVNNLNQYTAVGTVTPTWNTDGGLASYAGNSYVYDALGRLTEADYTTGKTLFSYDPMGRRVQKVDENTNGTVLSTCQYHYDGSQVAVEYRPEDTWTYFGSLMRTDGTNKQWYYQDGLGSTSAVADNSGNVLEAYEYTAQGHVQVNNGSGTVLTGTGIGNDLLYAGYRYDAETANYFCNARYYSPVLGRFISRDPLSGAEFSQGTNLYAYCRNDCVDGTDPTGMFEATLTLALDFGFQVNFGYNNGTFNIGGSIGAGEGISVKIDPGDSENGSSFGLVSSAEAGVGPMASVGVDSSYGLNDLNTAEGGLTTTVGADVSVGGKGPNLGGGVEAKTNYTTGITSGESSGSFSIGESLFLGVHSNLAFGGKKEKECPK